MREMMTHTIVGGIGYFCLLWDYNGDDACHSKVLDKIIYHYQAMF